MVDNSFAIIGVCSVISYGICKINPDQVEKCRNIIKELVKGSVLSIPQFFRLRHDSGNICIMMTKTTTPKTEAITTKTEVFISNLSYSIWNET